MIGGADLFPVPVGGNIKGDEDQLWVMTSTA